MNNYNKIINKLKVKISNFSKILTKDMSLPHSKFIFQMMYGLIESQSVMLSEISRALKEDISLKKTIDRLSRNLLKFNNREQLFNNYIIGMKNQINDETVFCIDLSEITKKTDGRKFESMCRVKDGSTGEIRDGYHLLEITALTKNKKMPISVYTELYSSEEGGFVSQNDEIIKGLESLYKNFGTKGIRVLDRGFDANVFYKHFMKSKEKFIIRSKKNRDVIIKGKRQNILKVANKYKGKYSLKLKNKDGEEFDLKISFIPIKLPCNLKEDLTLVVVYGFGETPMMLITNMNDNNKKVALTVTKVYLMRWRIEEYFKFKKQQFKLEDIRVRSINSIKNLNLILAIAVSFIGLISENKNHSMLSIEIIELSETIFKDKSQFKYYQIAKGIKNILEKSITGFSTFIKRYSKSKKEVSQELRLFELSILETSSEFAS